MLDILEEGTSPYRVLFQGLKKEGIIQSKVRDEENEDKEGEKEDRKRIGKDEKEKEKERKKESPRRERTRSFEDDPKRIYLREYRQIRDVFDEFLKRRRTGTLSQSEELHVSLPKTNVDLAHSHIGTPTRRLPKFTLSDSTGLRESDGGAKVVPRSSGGGAGGGGEGGERTSKSKKREALVDSLLERRQEEEQKEIEKQKFENEQERKRKIKREKIKFLAHTKNEQSIIERSASYLKVPPSFLKLPPPPPNSFIKLHFPRKKFLERQEHDASLAPTELFDLKELLGKGYCLLYLLTSKFNSFFLEKKDLWTCLSGDT